MTAAIARLKVTLDDVKPKVLRRIEVPADIRLDRLHLTLQAALGWTNSHLYEIRAKDVRFGLPDPDWPDGPLDARKARLIDVLEAAGTKTLRYLYDFGDGWEHTIKIERLADPEPNVAYPRLIEAAGRCPPEDVGGPWGYADLIEALEDPDHERHAEMREWVGEGFDPRKLRRRTPESRSRSARKALVEKARLEGGATRLSHCDRHWSGCDRVSIAAGPLRSRPQTQETGASTPNGRGGRPRIDANLLQGLALAVFSVFKGLEQELALIGRTRTAAACPFPRLASRNRACASRDGSHSNLGVEAFRGHTISGRGFNLFKPLRRHFRS